ncbi:hypothetical protein AAAC51_32235 [Priestia megaterium]
MLLPQLGPIVLENTIPLAAVGVFAVAYRIPSALYQVPGIVAGAFYPVLFRHYNHQQTDKHLQLNILQVKLMSLVGMLTALPFIIYPILPFHYCLEINGLQPEMR